MNSTETYWCVDDSIDVFYSSVILNSTETCAECGMRFELFYSSVILNSTARGTITRRRSEG